MKARVSLFVVFGASACCPAVAPVPEVPSCKCAETAAPAVYSSGSAGCDAGAPPALSASDCVPSDSTACYFHAELEHAVTLLAHLHRTPVVLLGTYDLDVTGTLPTRSLEQAFSALSEVAYRKHLLLDHSLRDGLHFFAERPTKSHTPGQAKPFACPPLVDLNLQRSALGSLVRFVADVSHRRYTETAPLGGSITAIGREVDACLLLGNVLALAGAALKQTPGRLEITGTPILPPVGTAPKPDAPGCPGAGPLDCWKAEDLVMVAVAGAPDARIALVQNRFGGDAFAPVALVRVPGSVGRDRLEVRRIDQHGLRGADGRVIPPAGPPKPRGS